MARDYTRRHNDQIRAYAGSTSECQDCASELPKLLLKRLDHSRCVPGNSSSPWTRMLFHTSDAKQTNNTSLTKAIRTRIAQIEAWKRTRNPETIPTNLRSPEDHETKNPTQRLPRTNTTKGRSNLSSQLWKTGTVGEQASWSRASAEWPQLLTSRETGPSSTLSPRRKLVTLRPSLH